MQILLGPKDTTPISFTFWELGSSHTAGPVIIFQPDTCKKYFTGLLENLSTSVLRTSTVSTT